MSHDSAIKKKKMKKILIETFNFLLKQNRDDRNTRILNKGRKY